MVYRQIVVDRTEGQYIAWIDGDIVIRKGYLATQVGFLDKNSRAGGVQGNRLDYKGKSFVGNLEIISMNNVSTGDRKFLATRGAVYASKLKKKWVGWTRTSREQQRTSSARAWMDTVI